MKNLGYYNGQIGLLEEMQVPMLDRACYFGDGLYDTTAIHNYIPYCLEDHVERLFGSAEKLGFNMPMTSDEVCALVRELCRRLDSGDQIMYLCPVAVSVGPDPYRLLHQSRAVEFPRRINIPESESERRIYAQAASGVVISEPVPESADDHERILKPFALMYRGYPHNIIIAARRRRLRVAYLPALKHIDESYE